MKPDRAQEHPADYLHYALQHPNGIIPSQYKDKLKTVLLGAIDNAGDVFAQFRDAAIEHAGLRSTFYTAVQKSFADLPHPTDGYPARWDGLMDVIASSAQTDPTLLKYVRDILMTKSIPTLVGPKTSGYELQMASDILTVAGKYPDLADLVKPQYVRPVVLWHLSNANHNFSWAATRLTMLRQTPPFVPVIADIENKRGVHVVGEHITGDETQILLVEFDKAKHTAAISVMDTSKRGHIHAPRPVELANDATAHHDQIASILLASTDLPKQEWVEPIATEMYYRLG